MLWSRHLYHEEYRLSQNITEKNTRKVSACFLCLHVVTSYNFETPTRSCVSEAHWRQWRVQNSNNKVNRFELLRPTQGGAEDFYSAWHFFCVRIIQQGVTSHPGEDWAELSSLWRRKMEARLLTFSSIFWTDSLRNCILWPFKRN